MRPNDCFESARSRIQPRNDGEDKMIVRTLEEAEKGNRRIEASNWNSVRLSLKDLESVYCISGEGEVETVDDGKVYPIRPGTIYILNKNDQHLLRATTEMKMACVFNPPLHGKETHDEHGVYPAEAEPITDAD